MLRTPFVVVGLGNPGEEYEATRHNMGRRVVSSFWRTKKFPAWKSDPHRRALISLGSVGREKVLLVLPETFMNQSGAALPAFLKKGKAATRFIVVHDDLDLPLGRLKISFDRNSGGHRGVASVAKVVGTDGFVRVRVGITPTTTGGVLKKPRGEKAVIDFILKQCKPAERTAFKNITRRACRALEVILVEGREKAMNEFNRAAQ